MSFAHISVVLGAFIVLISLPAVLAPQAFRRAVLAFPRSTWPGWILIAIDLAWVAWIIFHAPLGRFEGLKPALYFVAPVTFFLIVLYMEELLAPRALGGLLLLVANPVLNAARWHPSPWRLVVTVLMYAWVIAGMVFILSPFRLRHLAEFGTKTDARCRSLGLLRVIVGAAVIFLGVTVY